MIPSDEQLHLFGQPFHEGVLPDLHSPLYHPRIETLLGDFPKLRLGTSSWTFPGWSGLVYKQSYDASELARTGLKAYAKCPLFRTVSLDRSFYRPMTKAEYKVLADQVPADFRFIVKAPRDLLKPTAQGIDQKRFSLEFLTPTILGLQDRLGLILLQFSPGAALDFSGGLVTALAQFLPSLPADVTFSLELRDESLLTPALSKAMRDTSVSLCTAVHPTLPSPDQQLLRVRPTPNIPIFFRWNLRPSLEYKEAMTKFDPYSDLQLEDVPRRKLLARLVLRALQAGREVYLTANNHAEGCAPLSLLRLLEELTQQQGMNFSGTNP